MEPVDDPKQLLRDQILDLVREYYRVAHQRPSFVAGHTRIPYSGRIYDDREMTLLTESALDFWLTAGPYSERFERRMRQFFDSRDFLLVNSGSSANLLMVSTLCAPDLINNLRGDGPGPLLPGDEVITPSVTFPTTVAPIIQNRLVPVFVDCEVGTYNINPHLIEDAIGPRTKAIFVPHTVGNPCDMDIITEVATRKGLWLLEDGCDALGATFNGRLAGTFGAMSSLSFYPAHHITMGEGGSVLTNQPLLRTLVESFRDWGRDCWCAPGKDNTCGKRFDWQLGELPCGYDHKYTYSHIGYNLKLTDMQAAVGVAQLDKLSAFLAARRLNFRMLREGLRDLEEFFVLPEATPDSDPAWFGFPIAVRRDAPFSRNQVIQELESRKIATRLLFGGNLVRQPAYRDIQYRIAAPLKNTDFVMDQVFWIGVYPGLGMPAIDYMVESLHGVAAKNFRVLAGR